MQIHTALQGLARRFGHPLLTLLLAVIAAVGAIAQCGLLLEGPTDKNAGRAKPVAAEQRRPVATATHMTTPSRTVTAPRAVRPD